MTIPTNLRVTGAAKDRFGEFYAALFDQAAASRPGAVVTEYAWAASSCDPCPGPALDQGDFMTLGADSLPNPDQWRSWVLTRLHTRYSKDKLGEDLVFKAVGPITGGTGMPDANGNLPQELGAYSNMFQGRYAVLHPWDGALTCSNPQRGRWGGPPSGGGQGVVPATGLAFAPRGEIALASMVVSGLPGMQPTGQAAEQARPLESFGKKVVKQARPWYANQDTVVLFLLGLGVAGLVLYFVVEQLRDEKKE